MNFININRFYGKKEVLFMNPLRSTAHYFKNTDLYLLLLALCCSAYSLVLVNSATATDPLHDRFMLIQGIATGIGFFVFIIM